MSEFHVITIYADEPTQNTDVYMSAKQLLEKYPFLAAFDIYIYNIQALCLNLK